MAQEEPRNTLEAIMDHVAQGQDPSGDRRPIRVDSLGYLLPPPPRPGFRASIAVAAPAGFGAELIPGATVKCIVRGVFVSKPTVQTTVRLIKNRTASSGGTSTNATIVPLDSTHAAAGTTVKIFTAAPTAGTAVGDIAEFILETTDWMWFGFGEHGEPPLVLKGSSETLAVNFGTAATIDGYIAWSEEQL